MKEVKLTPNPPEKTTLKKLSLLGLRKTLNSRENFQLKTKFSTQDKIFNLDKNYQLRRKILVTEKVNKQK